MPKVKLIDYSRQWSTMVVLVIYFHIRLQLKLIDMRRLSRLPPHPCLLCADCVRFELNILIILLAEKLLILLTKFFSNSYAALKETFCLFSLVPCL
jgi:hypothetical protein